MQLVASLPCAPEVQEFRLDDCGKLQWESLPPMIKTLYIGGQFVERSFLEKAMYSISNACLESLTVRDCPDVEFIFCHSRNCLRHLGLTRCDSLRAFSFHFFPKLQELSLENCNNLESFSISESLDRSLPSLESLGIEGCPKFVSFPEGGFSAPNLKYFSIEKMQSLKSLPEGMYTLFPSLTLMRLFDCPQLECCEGGLQSGSLQSLFIWRCPKLVASRIKWSLHGCTSLLELQIRDENVESFPEQGLLPATLTYLSFWKCSNLKTLDYKGLCHLISLKTLHIRRCPRLEFLPKEGLPSSIFKLEISSCPMLKERCQKEKGEDWSKIAHIPYIKIDGFKDICT
ncbi:hypothetical protein RIF29_40031 [Crotalaria pallida]|uniref:Uncharacterized protein n=1 Tax=Crotalaria pallida TaxID=3830 RepID=A0AAN9E341_CROPI